MEISKEDSMATHIMQTNREIGREKGTKKPLLLFFFKNSKEWFFISFFLTN